MLLAILAGLSIAGGVISAIGNVLQGNQQAEQAELDAQKRRESQAVLEAELRTLQAEKKDIAADRLAATERFGIQQRALAIQGLQVSRQGAAAQGAAVARTGAGNLGGTSPLRQARAIERQTQQGVTLVQGEQRQAQLGYEDVLRGLTTRSFAAEAGIARTQFDIRWAGLEAEQLEEQADFYRTYGWLGAGSSFIGGITGALSIYANRPRVDNA